MSNILKEKFLLYRIRAKNDPDAFGLVYDTYVRRIYRFIFFKVRSAEQAEDITSDTFLKAWQYLKEKREVTHLQALLYNIARNAVIDWYRHNSCVQGTVSLDDSRLTGEAIVDGEKLLRDIDRRTEAERVIEKIHGLKDEWREVMVMRYLDGLSSGEIAEALGKTTSNVRIILHRATKVLTQSIRNEQPEPTTDTGGDGE
ncbi:RNA polymerase sigma factor [Candidatus Uhrbacteria bacterium]|nr:RNA polymerase sigma factor [Candidatus Uhrbacteria bacterium]